MADPVVTPQPETVPKTEFERVQAEARDSKQGLESLKSQLLSQDYLDYLESKKTTKPAASTTDLSKIQVGTLSLAELTTYIDQRTQAVANEVNKPHLTRISNVEAKLELNEVKEKYDDFKTFQPKVVEILQNAANDLTIEQAYLLAKAQAPAAPAATPAATPAPAKPSNERPGGTLPVAGDTSKQFKDGVTAGTAAWASVAAKHGITGDTI